MIRVSSSGNFNKTYGFLNKLIKRQEFVSLNRYGEMGVDALSKSTPIDSTMTAKSWEYKITKDRKGIRIDWYNTNEVNGTPVAVLIQYGHATGTGGYVIGRDFINPTMRPIFDKIADDVWKKVKT